MRVLPDWNRLAAINQLVRPFLNQDVRRAALNVLEGLGAAGGQYEGMLQAALSALRSGTNQNPAALASCRYDSGGIPGGWNFSRTNSELLPGDANRRVEAVACLCCLGEIAPALLASYDSSPAVRARLAETLGSIARSVGRMFWRNCCWTPIPKVSNESRKALRLMGRAEASKPRVEARGVQRNSPCARCWQRSARLGEPGAAEDEIEAAERRLGVRLPPSYRAFLAESNGFYLGSSIERLDGAGELEWFRDSCLDWIVAYEIGKDISPEEHLRHRTDNTFRFRYAHLRSCLQISEAGDSAVLLLNPEVVDSDEEWEAWFFANWLPGAAIHGSFRELLENELRELKNNASRE